MLDEQYTSQKEMSNPRKGNFPLNANTRKLIRRKIYCGQDIWKQEMGINIWSIAKLETKSKTSKGFLRKLSN